MIPTLHITPKITTSKESSVVFTERKNNNSIRELSIKEPSKKNFISCCILSATTVRINGSPLKCASIFVWAEKVSTAVEISATIRVRTGEFSESLLMRTPIKYARVVSVLYNKFR